MNAVIGVIGGSGLYQLPGLTHVTEEAVATPFGAPSDVIVCGELQGVKVRFLPRHGRGHRFLPSEVNFRANIAALKRLGCTHVLSVSAVGSLKENVAPGDFVLVDQFFDWTKNRVSTFFGQGLAGHLPFGDPICRETQGIVASVMSHMKIPFHRDGTYVCIEGPQFSTKAESAFYRQLGATVVGMTNCPESKLAREAGMSYVTLAAVTDFDCWHPDHDHVTVETVVATLNQNVDRVKKIIAEAIPAIAAKTSFPFRGSRLPAIMTAESVRNEERWKELKFLFVDEI